MRGKCFHITVISKYIMTGYPSRTVTAYVTLDVCGRICYLRKLYIFKNIIINYIRLKEYFFQEYIPQQCEAVLWKILDKWLSE